MENMVSLKQTFWNSFWSRVVHILQETWPEDPMPRYPAQPWSEASPEQGCPSDDAIYRRENSMTGQCLQPVASLQRLYI